MRQSRLMFQWRGITGAGLALALLASVMVVSSVLVGGPQAAAASPFDASKVVDSFVAGGTWTNVLSADWLANGHMLVLEKSGLVYDVDPATGASNTALDLSSEVYDQGEAGAMDLLVDKAGTGFFVYYAVSGSDRLRVSHFTVGSSAEQVIWTNPGLGYDTSNPYHIGGSLNYGPDGKLYLGIGDQTKGLSQDLTNVFGKILRINTDGSVPTDNPFYDGAGSNIDEIWAYGLRNPYRTSFDPVTGRYWVGDVGGNVATQAYEEVDIVTKGANYGWPLCEGPLGQPKNGPVCPAGVTGPVYSYPHDSDGGVLSEPGHHRWRALSGDRVPVDRVLPVQRLPDQFDVLVAVGRRRGHCGGDGDVAHGGGELAGVGRGGPRRQHLLVESRPGR